MFIKTLNTSKKAIPSKLAMFRREAFTFLSFLETAFTFLSFLETIFEMMQNQQLYCILFVYITSFDIIYKVQSSLTVIVYLNILFYLLVFENTVAASLISPLKISNIYILCSYRLWQISLQRALFIQINLTIRVLIFLIGKR